MTSAAILLALLLLAANVRRVWNAIVRHRLAARPQNAPSLAASIWYERMVRRVGRAGWKKTPTQTPGEFVESIPDLAIRQSVQQFTARYEKARFAGSSSDAKQLAELYEEVSSMAKK